MIYIRQTKSIMKSMMPKARMRVTGLITVIEGQSALFQRKAKIARKMTSTMMK